MTVQRNNKVRFVRCPKCRQLLPEFVEVPVYICGGCGTVLQAKNRKKVTQEAEAFCEGNNFEHFSEEKQKSSLSEEPTPANEIPLLGNSSERSQHESGGCSTEQLGTVNIPKEAPSSSEIPSCKDELSTANNFSHMVSNEGLRSMDQRDKKRDTDFDMNRSKGTSFEVSSEAVHKPPLSTACLSEDEAMTEMEESKYSLKQRKRRNGNQISKSVTKFPEKMDTSNEVSLSPEVTVHRIEEPSPMAKVDIDFKNDESQSIIESSMPENSSVTSQRDDIIMDQISYRETVSPESIMSGDHEFDESTTLGLDHENSLAISENLSQKNHSSDLSVIVEETFKSPTSKAYCAYDGSASSFDGVDEHEQVSDGNVHLSKRNLKDKKAVSVEGLNGRDEFMMKSDSQMQHQKMQSSSILIGHQKMQSSSVLTGKRHHHIPKGSSCLRDALDESATHGCPVRRCLQREKGNYLPKLPFYSHDGCGSDNPIHRNHAFPSCSSFHPHSKYPEPDKRELLSMVFELQSQLNRIYVSQDYPNGRFPVRIAGNEKQATLFHNRFEDEGLMNPDLSYYPRYFGGCSHIQDWPQQCKMPRRAFTREASQCRYGGCLSCSHCSTELPPRVAYCNKQHRRPYTAYNSSVPHRFHFSSLQHYPSSNISTSSHDMDSQEDCCMKNMCTRETHYSKRRHIRPVAGGVPLISCYRCTGLLQLPAEFLNFQRRRNRLRCSSCSEVLKFTLESKSHVVPCDDAFVAASGEDDDMNFMDDDARRSAMASRVSDCAHTEAVSYSDDYGKSLCRTCSTDVDHVKMSSISSSERIQGRKESVSAESQGKDKNPAENFEPAGSSSKISRLVKLSSKIEELPRKTGSPLHRLLGYSSPRKLINGS